MANKKCVFCGIAERESERMVYEGKDWLVFLSNPRLMAGHLLVVPKRHVDRVAELIEKERKELFELLVKYQGRILERWPGCDIRQHYRPFKKDNWIKVGHLHFHLQPRELKDELYEKAQKYETELFGYMAVEERERELKFYRE